VLVARRHDEPPCAVRQTGAMSESTIPRAIVASGGAAAAGAAPARLVRRELRLLQQDLRRARRRHRIPRLALLSNLTLLIGAEFNAERARARTSRAATRRTTSRTSPHARGPSAGSSTGPTGPTDHEHEPSTRGRGLRITTRPASLTWRTSSGVIRRPASFAMLAPRRMSPGVQRLGRRALSNSALGHGRRRRLGRVVAAHLHGQPCRIEDKKACTDRDDARRPAEPSQGAGKQREEIDRQPPQLKIAYEPQTLRSLRASWRRDQTQRSDAMPPATHRARQCRNGRWSLALWPRRQARRDADRRTTQHSCSTPTATRWSITEESSPPGRCSPARERLPISRTPAAPARAAGSPATANRRLAALKSVQAATARSKRRLAGIQGGYLLSTLHKDVRPMKDALEAILAYLRSFAAPGDR